MFKGLGNLASMMSQAKNIGSKMNELAERMKRERVSGQSGGGLVTVVASGTGEIISVQIDPSLFQQQDQEMIQDLLPAAINDALVKGREMNAAALQEITGGMPGLGDMMNRFGAGGHE